MVKHADIHDCLGSAKTSGNGSCKQIAPRRSAGTYSPEAAYASGTRHLQNDDDDNTGCLPPSNRGPCASAATSCL